MIFLIRRKAVDIDVGYTIVQEFVFRDEIKRVYENRKVWDKAPGIFGPPRQRKVKMDGTV